MRATDASTLVQALALTAAAHPGIVALRTLDDHETLTWSELECRAHAIAGGLTALGLRHGDTVGLLLTNRLEFAPVDLGAVTLGAIPFSIYTTYPADEIAYLVNDASARIVVTEQAFLPLLGRVRDLAPAVEHVIVVDGDAPAGVWALAAIEAMAPNFDGAAAGARVAADDLVTLIYTSGTTGPPKAVQLTHRNVMSAVRGGTEIRELEPGSRVISWLPAAHIAERMAHHYIPTARALTVTVCPDSREIGAVVAAVHPNWFFAVPRVWEKIKGGLEAMQASQAPERQEHVRRALAAAIERLRLRQRGEPVPPALEAAVAAADAEIFSRLRVLLGLDQLQAVNVGAAPTAIEVLEFFHAIGIEIAELWGMSETAGYGLTNRPGEVRLGTVGRCSPGSEVRLAEDGELLIRGPFVMPGYRSDPENSAFTPEGWLRTGDIADVDDDGYVRIVDRKKELIINSAGKNMSPANIEATLKSASLLIGQCCCIGDRRPYNTALIVLDSDYAPVWAGQQGLTESSLERLAREPLIADAVQAGIDQANLKLSRVQQIKRFTLVAGDWLPGGDELTPTMKLKRRPIAEKYAGAIEAMYATAAESGRTARAGDRLPQQFDRVPDR